MSVLALQLPAAQHFIEELLIGPRERSASSSASSRGRLRSMSQGGRWAITAAMQGASSSAHAAGFSRSHACTHRKAAEEVISLSNCVRNHRESEKARKRELGIFLFFRFRQQRLSRSLKSWSAATEFSACGWRGSVRSVVRKEGLYHPNSFGFSVPKPCKTAKFFNPLNVFPMSPVFVTTPFLVQKALKTANSEKCVFRVRREKCCLSLQIRLFSAENLLQVFAVLRNPYSALKNLRIPAR